MRVGRHPPSIRGECEVSSRRAEVLVPFSYKSRGVCPS